MDSNETMGCIHTLEMMSMELPPGSERSRAVQAGIEALWSRNRKTGWEVLDARCSERNGGLYVRGVNHETESKIDRNFTWHIGAHSVKDNRFNFQGCEFAAGARERLDRMITKGY